MIHVPMDDLTTWYCFFLGVLLGFTSAIIIALVTLNVVARTSDNE